MWRLRAVLGVLLLALCILAACGDQREPAVLPVLPAAAPALTTVAGTTLPPPVPTSHGTLLGPIPPTLTPVLPPDYRTATPIPPEHQHFFIAMGNGGNGVPAVQPSGSGTPGLTKADIEQYVTTHTMRGDQVTISYAHPPTALIGVEPAQLVDVYRRYMPEAPAQPWQAPYPPDTPVYVAELRGVFRFSGGPSPGNRGTYQTGVWVFDASTGYDLLEGGVGRMDRP